MASACVNNSIGSYTWLTPTPRLSFSRENDPSSSKPSDLPESPDPADFEFRLEDPVAMLPADQLFSDGKLVPLHVTTLRPTTSSSTVVRVKSSRGGGGDESSASASAAAAAAVKSCDDISGMAMDSYLFSPKAPRCSSRWRELLGFKRLSQSQNGAVTTQHQARNSKSSSIKHFLHRNSTKSSSSSSSTSSSSSFSLDSALNLPLLKDSDSESVSISSSRLSLSSSSSGHEHEDLPRLSLDSDKPNPNPFAANPVRMRMVKPNQTGSTTSRVGRSPMRRDTSASTTSRGVSVDSPRLNSSGKIVFQSLERSSSSPSSFNGGGGGGQRFKQRGMERSYSANVRVTPVLNVPVCSLRGSSKSGSVFGFFSSSPQKSGTATTRQLQMNNCRNRTTDRT